jgi:hypothetical protein
VGNESLPECGERASLSPRYRTDYTPLSRIVENCQEPESSAYVLLVDAQRRHLGM